MKKLLSIILCFAMLSGVFSILPVSASDDTPYSGGSGTEDDPYLISTKEDIKEVQDNIANDPSLWSKKVYYKLTNDITTDVGFTPVKEYQGIAPHCFVEAGVDISIFKEDKAHYEEILNGTYEPYFEEYFEEFGPLYFVGYSDYSEWPYYYYSQYSLYAIDDIDDIKYYPNIDYIESFHAYSGVSSPLLREAAFTGVLDGNGHTIKMQGASYGFLFGALCNGAVVKNLKLKGYDTSWAYKIDETSTLKNCIYEASTAEEITYIWGGQGGMDGEREDYYNEWQSTVGGPVVECYGSVVDCINASYFEEWVYDEAESFVNLSKKVTGDISESYYTLEECKAAGGDISAFEYLDFENTWTMIDGMPTLKVFCDRGDVDFDGMISGKDVNELRRTIATRSYVISESEFIVFDINGDSKITAKDLLGLRKTITNAN